MKAFFNKLRSRSRKGKDTPKGKVQQSPQQSPLPESPPAPSTAATQSGIKSGKPPPKFPSGRLPPLQPPPVLEPSESSANTSSFSTIATTTATTVDANESVSPASSSSSPNLSTGIANTAWVQQTARAQRTPRSPYSRSNGSYTTGPTSRIVLIDDSTLVGLGSRERTRQKILSEFVLSEEM